MTDRTLRPDQSVAVIGVLLMLLAAPLIFLALIYGSGGEMLSFIQSGMERLWVASFVGLPVCLFAIGTSLVWANRRGSYVLTLVTFAALLIDLVALAALTWQMRQPEPPPSIPAPDPHVVISAPAIPTAHRPELRTIRCSSAEKRCEATSSDALGVVPAEKAPDPISARRRSR